MLQARTINDLVVKSVERQTLWRALRERSGADQIYQSGQDELELDESLLALLLGFKQFSESPEEHQTCQDHTK
jgi:hypothetical protein